jgi:hypothetical protein
MSKPMPSLSEEQLAEKVQQLLFDEPYPLEPLLELFHQYGVSERIDELNKLVKEWGYSDYPADDPRYSMDWETWAEYRKAELTQSDSREGGE